MQIYHLGHGPTWEVAKRLGYQHEDLELYRVIAARDNRNAEIMNKYITADDTNKLNNFQVKNANKTRTYFLLAVAG